MIPVARRGGQEEVLPSNVLEVPLKVARLESTVQDEEYETSNPYSSYVSI